MLLYTGVYLSLSYALLMAVRAEGDLVHRLYQLEREGETADPVNIKESALPTDIVERLMQLKLRWDALPGLLQRAVLWDAGLVFVTPTKLVQVYTRCSKTMSDLVFSRALAESVTRNDSNCEIYRCGTHNHFLFPNCPTDLIAPVTRCAVEPAVEAQYSSSVYWAEDGQSPEVPNPVIRLHSMKDVSKHVLYAIHLSDEEFQDQSSCKLQNNFILPCQEKKETDIDFCVPAPGSTLDAWLRLVATPPQSSFSSTSIILLAVLLVICIGFALALWHVYRKNAHFKSQGIGSMEDSLLMSGDAHPGAHGSAPMEYFNTAHFATDGTDGSDDTLSNDHLLGKSNVLRRFVADPAVITKRICFPQLNFLRVLSKGGNGEVWLGQFESQYVAIKCLLPSKRNDVSSMETFSDEIRLASVLEHPRIVSFCGVAWQSLSQLCVVTEYMEGGDLETLLAKAQDLSWYKEKIMIALDIADALVYLHSLDPLVIHRDLKSKNVLLDRHLRAKLSDFGLSRETSLEETMTNGIGTILWSAPEVLEGRPYDEKADIFSFGIVLSEIDTCALPYGFTKDNGYQMKSIQIVHLVSEGKLVPTFLDSCPPEIVALARRCTDLDPSRRPSALEVVYTLRSKILPVFADLQDQLSSGQSTAVVPLNNSVSK